MGVISNKVDITQLQISGGGGGDPTIPGRVSALENEMTGVYASINQISTVELPKVYSSINEISTVELPKVYSSINANTQAILTGSVNMADKVKMNNNSPIRFGVDGDGNYGYIKVGADTVTPFLTGGGGGEIVYFDSLRPTTNTTFEITDPKITAEPRAVIIQPVGTTWNTTDGVINAATYYLAGEGSVQHYGFLIRGSGSSLFARSVNTIDFRATYSDGTLTIKTSSSYNFPLTTNYHVFIIT